MFRGNRLYLIGVAAMMIGLLIASLMLELNTQQRIKDIDFLATAQSRKADVAEYIRLMVDAESGQRGYLLTQDPQYLVPYESGRNRAPLLIDKISNSYLFDGDAPASDVTRGQLQRLRELGSAKMEELAASITMNSTNRREAALELVRTNYGRRTMSALRTVAEQFDEREDAQIGEALERWKGGTFASRAMLAGGTVLNIALLVLVAFLLDRDLRRREATKDAMEQHTHDLEELVQRRTAELSALSSHLQHVAEREKAAIARELHDELGGIMVAAKMDVSWLEKRLATDDPGLTLRWTRLRKLLDDGLNLKRRVVETLRPTLLDNMGLVSAVQWIYQETCGRAGLNVRAVVSRPGDPTQRRSIDRGVSSHSGGDDQHHQARQGIRGRVDDGIDRRQFADPHLRQRRGYRDSTRCAFRPGAREHAASRHQPWRDMEDQRAARRRYVDRNIAAADAYRGASSGDRLKRRTMVQPTRFERRSVSLESRLCDSQNLISRSASPFVMPYASWTSPSKISLRPSMMSRLSCSALPEGAQVTD